MILKFQVTHDVLANKNNFGQTLLTLIEINRESLQESLIIVIRLELALHNNDSSLAENCLRNHLESSVSTFEIVSLLHQQVPPNLCKKIYNWTVLILVSVITGVGLTFVDIYSDVFLSTEYYKNMSDPTAVQYLDEKCTLLKQFNNQTVGNKNLVIMMFFKYFNFIYLYFFQMFKYFLEQHMNIALIMRVDFTTQ